MALPASAFKSRHKNAGRPAHKSAPGYLKWLRGRRCACGGKLLCCDGKVVAAHVDHGGDKGMASKASDKFAIPLSNGCHGSQHSVGWRTFERQLPGRDAVMLAAIYWRNWPGRAAWEQANG